jgi:hypothetical protein
LRQMWELLWKNWKSCNWEPYSQSRIILCFFLIRESKSWLAAEVLTSGNGGTKGKTMKTSHNKSFLSSRARMLKPNPWHAQMLLH